MTDYSKNAPPTLVTWNEAAASLFNGFCIRRQGWSPEQYAFMVKSAQFTAMDYVTGFVDEFLVKRIGHRDVIFLPSKEDQTATDWTIYTRQQTHSFPRIEERSTKRVAEPEPEMIDVTPAE